MYLPSDFWLFHAVFVQDLSHNNLFVSISVPGICLCVEDLTRESKENQWMGVTVNSQGPGGKIVVRLCVFVSHHDLECELQLIMIKLAVQSVTFKPPGM